MSSRAVDAAVLAALFALAALIIALFPLAFLPAAAVLALPSTTYLCWRRPKHLLRVVLGGVLVGAIGVFMLDFAGVKTSAWLYHGDRLLFPAKVAGVVPLEIILWGFLWSCWIIVFYEHFFEADTDGRISRNYLPFLAVSAVGACLLPLVPPVVWDTAKHGYLWNGLFTLWPVVWVAYTRRRIFLRTILPAAALLCAPNFLFEVASLVNGGYWSFPGRYGYLLPGGFPLEEVIFWVLLDSLVTLCVFELFVACRNPAARRAVIESAHDI